MSHFSPATNSEDTVELEVLPGIDPDPLAVYDDIDRMILEYETIGGG